MNEKNPQEKESQGAGSDTGPVSSFHHLSAPNSPFTGFATLCQCSAIPTPQGQCHSSRDSTGEAF